MTKEQAAKVIVALCCALTIVSTALILSAALVLWG